MFHVDGSVSWTRARFSRQQPEKSDVLMPTQDLLNSAGPSTAIAAQLFTNYSRNVTYNLEAVGKMPKPQ